MEQKSSVTKVKDWLDSQPPVSRAVVVVGLVVLACLLLVVVISLILGRADKLSFSNALFYASAAMFAIALLIYFGNRGGSANGKEEAGGSADGETVSDFVRKRRREVPFYSVTMIAAGIALFLLSIAIWYVLP